jgi:hypothetical protein
LVVRRFWRKMAQRTHRLLIRARGTDADHTAVQWVGATIKTDGAIGTAASTAVAAGDADTLVSHVS